MMGVAWEDMSDEMLSELVFDLPRLIGPWARAVAPKRPTWFALELPTHACGYEPRARLRVVGRWCDKRDEFVYRWQASLLPDVFEKEGECMTREGAQREAEDIMRARGFRFLPHAPHDTPKASHE